jgi:hypothetical protein
MDYLVTTKSGARITFKYNSNNVLKAFEIEAEEEFDLEMMMWFQEHLPIHEEFLDTNWKGKEGIVIREIVQDLTFVNFWNTYSYKMGNKKRAEKLYNKLSEAEKAQCFVAIKRYNQYLAQRPSMERAYPETWLNQRRFENEFK